MTGYTCNLKIFDNHKTFGKMLTNLMCIYQRKMLLQNYTKESLGKVNVNSGKLIDNKFMSRQDCISRVTSNL